MKLTGFNAVPTVCRLARTRTSRVRACWRGANRLLVGLTLLGVLLAPGPAEARPQARAHDGAAAAPVAAPAAPPVEAPAEGPADATPHAPALAGPLWATPPGVEVPDARAALALYRGGGFVPLRGNLARGYARGIVWLAAELPVDARHARELVLDVAPGYLDHVTAYQARADGTLRLLGVAGDQVPQSQRALQSPGAAFPVQVPAGESTAVLLRIQTVSTQAAMVSVHSRSSDAASQFRTGLVLGGLFTVSLLMLLLALGLWVLSRQHSFLLWGANVVVVSGLWALLHGVPSLLLPDDRLHWANAAMGPFNLLSLVVGTLFMRAVFEVRTLSPTLHRLLGAGVLLLPLVMLAGARAPGPVLLMTSLPLFALTALAIVWQMVRRERVGLLYGPAFLLYLGASLHNLLATLGWVPFDRLSFYGWQVAGCLNLVWLLVALVAQVRRSRDLHAQERLRLLRELSDRNAQLEHRVAARTQTLEAALRDVQRAESEQRELLSMASHEFRTPAAVIKASLDSLDLLQDKAPPEVLARLGNIRAASQRMTRLADDVITHERLREPDLPMNRVVIDLRQVLQEAARHYPDARVLLGPLHEQAVPVRIDAALIGIALHNLLDNALRYHPDEALGPVLVTLSLQPVAAPLQACIEVSDQGVGVPDAAKPMIFERFYVVPREGHDEPVRTLASGSRLGRSHGLGLAIVRRIAQAHGGTVSVRDNQPRGAVFTLSLPLASAQTPR